MPATAATAYYQATDVDIMGYKRGAHERGKEICAQYKFHVPGKNGIYGWNDVAAMNCAACGYRDIHHILIEDVADKWLTSRRALAEKEAEQIRQSEMRQMTSYATKPALALGQAEKMEWLLDDATDPLAALSRSSRDPILRDSISAEHAPAQQPAEASRSQELESNERFKEEVERMVRESVAAERGGKGAGKLPRLSQSLKSLHRESDGAAVHVSCGAMYAFCGPTGPVVSVEKLEALSRLPDGAPASVDELLTSLGLERYIEPFRREGLDLALLIACARGDGKEALDEALKEVGVSSVGHRLKIYAALQ